MGIRSYFPHLRRGLGGALGLAGAPLHLTLFVTGRCNLRCRHCFHWEGVEAGLGGPSLEQVTRLADSAAGMGPLLWVAFGGGEPFLREDLVELGASFARRGLRHLSIPTNGLVGATLERTEGLLAACPDTFLNVAVSIDGPPDVHDAIRAVPGGHARSVEAARNLQELGARHERLGVGLILTVTAENQDTLAEHLEELVRDVRPDHVTINLARGTAMDEGLLEVDPDRYREVVQTKRRLHAGGLLPGYDHAFGRLAGARDELMYEHVERVARASQGGPPSGAALGRRHLPCSAGRLSAVIFEDGRVQACEIRGDSLGNMNDVDWDLSRLWSSPAADTLRKDIRATRCACTWECAQADNVLFGPRAWPRLAARVLSR